jgi:hypothetical protein
MFAGILAGLAFFFGPISIGLLFFLLLISHLRKRGRS